MVCLFTLLSIAMFSHILVCLGWETDSSSGVSNHQSVGTSPDHGTCVLKAIGHFRNRKKHTGFTELTEGNGERFVLEILFHGQFSISRITDYFKHVQ